MASCPVPKCPVVLILSVCPLPVVDTWDSLSPACAGDAEGAGAHPRLHGGRGVLWGVDLQPLSRGGREGALFLNRLRGWWEEKQVATLELRLLTSESYGFLFRGVPGLPLRRTVTPPVLPPWFLLPELGGREPAARPTGRAQSSV